MTAEDAIWQECEANNLLTARRLAEELLVTDPESYVAHYAVGRAYSDEDGNLGKARFHFDEADRLYDRLYPAPGSETPWERHYLLVWYRYNTAHLQEDFEAELSIMDHHDAFFDPDVGADRGWALMKLGRDDEARAVAEAGLASEDREQQSLGNNVLCVLESEAGHREAGNAACFAAYEHERTDASPDLTVDACNAASSAMTVFDHGLVERLYKEATTGGTNNATNPWGYLSWLYVLEGRGSEALSAVENMQAWRARQPADMRDQSRAETDVFLARFLLAAGRPDRAMPIIDRAIAFPDRRAMNSEGEEQSRGAALLLRTSIRKALRAREDEEASTYGVWMRWTHWLASWAPDFQDWSDRRRVAAVLVDERRLARTVRPYMDGGVYIPPWQLGDLFPIAGDGVISAVLEAQEPNEELPAASGYYEAYRAELAWRAGDREAVLTHADRAFAQLSTSEVALRARVAALAGDLAWRHGDLDQALAYQEDALLHDPGVFRRLNLRVPASVAVDTPGAVPDAVGDMLWRSPRFSADGRGFSVRIDGDAQSVSVCLFGASGATLSCTDVDRPAPEEGQLPIDDAAFARLVAMEFHDRAFGLALGASVVDYDSLDGTTTARGQDARERVDKLLEQLP